MDRSFGLTFLRCPMHVIPGVRLPVGARRGHKIALAECVVAVAAKPRNTVFEILTSLGGGALSVAISKRQISFGSRIITASTVATLLSLVHKAYQSNRHNTCTQRQANDGLSQAKLGRSPKWLATSTLPLRAQGDGRLGCGVGGGGGD